MNNYNKLWRYLWVLSFVALPIVCYAQRISVSDAYQAEAKAWADSVMQTLSARERLTQLFVPRLDITDNVSGYKQLQAVVAGEKVGGILLGKGTMSSYANLLNKAQMYSHVPLMVTLDGEWGPAMRVAGVPRFMSNIALGAADDEALVRKYGEEVARECRLLGIQVNFAPVLDVNSNPKNPVIGYRSFGEDPSLVGRLGKAYCMGLESGGVMSVGKHFPGHGDTSVDSHKALPTVDHNVETIKSVDFLPFVSAMNGGMSGVMVGHLRVPSLDEKGTPASLSKRITTDWLQDSLRFKGLIFTDALAMKGASTATENNCVSAFLAGADVLLGSGSPISDIRAMHHAIKQGKIQQSEVDRRCRKLLEYKYKLGLYRKPMININGLSEKINTIQAQTLIEEMALKSVTILNNKQGALPLVNKNITVVSIGSSANNEFSNKCAEYSEVKKYSVTRNNPLSTSVISSIKQSDAVVIVMFSSSSWAKKAYKSIAGLQNVVAGVFLINPFRMAELFPEPNDLPGLVVGYDDVKSMRTVAAKALFGDVDVTGHLPINISGVGKIGDGDNIKKTR